MVKKCQLSDNQYDVKNNGKLSFLFGFVSFLISVTFPLCAMLQNVVNKAITRDVLFEE
jgi:hypothetical protein